MKNENELIAEFMGHKRHVNTEKEISFYGGDFVAFDIQYLKYSSEKIKGKWLEPIAIGHMKFHESWDWLMPVVEKIESIEEKDDNRIITKWVHILGKGCIIEIDKGFTPDIIVCSEFNNPMSKIEATYLAVIEFIKLYNKNKK